MIENVFSNILSNAIKYSPDGGKIEVNIIGSNNHNRIYVKDWGIGLKDEEKARLFTRFQTMEKGGIKGTGLGLAIFKRIVDLHGGRTWTEDNPEKGSIFLCGDWKVLEAIAGSPVVNFEWLFLYNTSLLKKIKSIAISSLKQRAQGS
jgi:light-regulated signal transduction histidine kinase (bacteriophytochrome)